MFGREERARRRHALKELESELDKKNQDLVTAESSLRRARREVKRLERSLECQICREELWDTVTGCGHLFGAECIKQWLETSPTWVEDIEAI
jgi:Zinc finger, C3HC4 type (RING finger)